MEAILWLHEKKCRIMLKSDGKVVDKDDNWNNRASAEMTVRMSVPEATMRFVRDADEIQALNKEWDLSLIHI